ncbi:hypothetical protein V6N13_095523 [Hibiscus sabdariffa]|uniref:O-methyltransferase C-terminal domain-containing protein n=1 Tax=Hibiscus sabdariffa TaxID=183260 RepID=A0ABR2PRG6_9ROSI
MEGGVPFERVHGMNVFAYPGKDPSFNQVFNTAMINHTTLVLKNILDNYNGFEQISCLVDVAGGLEITLSLITSKIRIYLQEDCSNECNPHEFLLSSQELKKVYEQKGKR